MLPRSDWIFCGVWSYFEFPIKMQLGLNNCFSAFLTQNVYVLYLTDHRRYAVFCLVKIGTEIYDTSLISTVDRNMTDLSFDDVIVL